jgi:hypothetical protein
MRHYGEKYPTQKRDARVARVVKHLPLPPFLKKGHRVNILGFAYHAVLKYFPHRLLQLLASMRP